MHPPWIELQPNLLAFLLPKEKITPRLSVLVCINEPAVAESTTLLIWRPLDSFHYVTDSCDSAVNPQNALQGPSRFTLNFKWNSFINNWIPHSPPAPFLHYSPGWTSPSTTSWCFRSVLTSSDHMTSAVLVLMTTGEKYPFNKLHPSEFVHDTFKKIKVLKGCFAEMQQKKHFGFLKEP